MRIYVLFSLLIIVTLSWSNFQNSNEFVNYSNELNRSLLQTTNEETSRPILTNVMYSKTGTVANRTDATILKARDDLAGEGGIHQVSQYSNVTLTYEIINASISTEVLLHTDVPSVNSTLSLDNKTAPALTFDNRLEPITNYKLPYSGELTNGTLLSFAITFNMTSDFAIFYAEINGVSEEAGGIRNLLTTQNTTFLSNLTESLIVQREEVEIEFTITNQELNNTYGIQYKTATEERQINFSVPIEQTSSGLKRYNVAIGNFAVGETVEFSTILYLNDTTNNAVKRLEFLDRQTFEINDGSPQIEFVVSKANSEDSGLTRTVEGKVYSSVNTIETNISLTVIKGSISQVNLVYTNIDRNERTTRSDINFVKGNLSGFVSDTFTFTSFGNWEINATISTDIGISSSDVFEVIIDTVAPIAAITSPANSATIQLNNGSVNFVFSYSDELSGIQMATLELGDGYTFEVTNQFEFNYRYKKTGTYGITLTVQDIAGNQVKKSILIRIEIEDAPELFAPLSFLPIFTVFGIFLFIRKFNRKKGI